MSAGDAFNLAKGYVESKAMTHKTLKTQESDNEVDSRKYGAQPDHGLSKTVQVEDIKECEQIRANSGVSEVSIGSANSDQLSRKLSNELQDFVNKTANSKQTPGHRLIET
jgi:hypothetical protein